MRSGIAIAGNILVDKINKISSYPPEGELTKINEISLAVGGCVPNVGIDLKKIDSSIPVYALGCIGKDSEGEYALNVMKDNNLDVSMVRYTDKKTSFTDVMSVEGGQRTFFTYPGANSEFGETDVDFDNLKADMLHLGYFLLLDKIDAGEGEKILRLAKQKGISTSIDLVSENSDRYRIVLPCLPYTDNLIINEVEAGNITGISPTQDNLVVIAKKLKKLGVIDRVIIHTPSLSVCVSNTTETLVSSYSLPQGFIKGTTGAGDAFCAGALLGIYRGWSDEDILSFASASAVANLSQPDATSGMRSEDEIRELVKNMHRQ